MKQDPGLRKLEDADDEAALKIWSWFKEISLKVEVVKF